MLSDEQGFVQKIDECLDLFTPLCKLINKSQDPSFNVAEATQYWLQIKQKIDNSDYDEAIDASIKKALWPVGFAANLLHHKFRGELLNDSQREQGESFIMDNSDYEGIQEYDLFNFENEYCKEYTENCKSAITFWTLVAATLPKLANFAIKLMLIPASTALIESLFSSWKFVHSLYRNRLGFQKTCKLIDVYYTLRHNGRNKIPL